MYFICFNNIFRTCGKLIFVYLQMKCIFAFGNNGEAIMNGCDISETKFSKMAVYTIQVDQIGLYYHHQEPKTDRWYTILN